MDYYFGLGDGPLTWWAGEPSLALGDTGLLDAVPLDFDGDGRWDDAMWDSDGDGVADRAVLDLDDDGVREAVFTDPGRLGTWAVRGGPVDAGDPPEARRTHLDVDEDGDGEPDSRLLDSDGDGYLDAVAAPLCAPTSCRVPLRGIGVAPGVSPPQLDVS